MDEKTAEQLAANVGGELTTIPILRYYHNGAN